VDGCRGGDVQATHRVVQASPQNRLHVLPSHHGGRVLLPSHRALLGDCPPTRQGPLTHLVDRWQPMSQVIPVTQTVPEDRGTSWDWGWGWEWGWVLHGPAPMSWCAAAQADDRWSLSARVHTLGLCLSCRLRLLRPSTFCLSKRWHAS